MYVQVFCMSLGWFDSTDALVLGGSTAVNFLEPSRTTSTRESNVCRGYRKSSGWFGYTEPSLTTSSQGNQGL